MPVGHEWHIVPPGAFAIHADGDALLSEDAGEGQGLRAIAAQRAALQRLCARGEIGEEAFHRIQEELDWSELDSGITLLSDLTEPPGAYHPIDIRAFIAANKAHLKAKD